MSITQEDAVRIAREHGLTLTDAESLQRLANTPEEATTLAREFVRPRQLTREALKGMMPEQIVAAKDAGQLDDLLGIQPKTEPEPTAAATVEPPAPTRPTEGLHSGSVGSDDNSSQLSRRDLEHMSPQEILAAKAEGRFNVLLGIK